MTFLPLFIPVCLIVFVVIEAIRCDEPKVIVSRALKSMGMLVAMMVVFGTIVYLFNTFF